MRRRNSVLVVDDSVESLNFLTDVLEQAGLTVFVALNGDSAITLVERVAPDIVLLDAVMPGRDGFDTCRHLKSNAAYVDLPIIFMTGLSETEHVIKGFQAGGVDYVTKPIVPDELLVRVRRHIETAQNMQSARSAIDLTGRFLIAVDTAGQLVWATPQAGRLLSEVLGDEDAGVLFREEANLAWLNGPRENGGVPKPIKIHDTVLNIAYVGKVTDKEIILRIFVDKQGGNLGSLKAAFGLTDREADVLYWISEGKTNKDIADILGLSHRTINKYLDRIYAKMNVENRATAAANAVRVLSN